MVSPRRLGWMPVLVTLGLIATAPLPASAATITFDALPLGIEVGGSFASSGVLFESAVTLIPSGGAHTPPLAICGGPPIPTCSEDTTLTFVDPLNSAVPATTDFITVFFLDVQVPNNQLTAFDIDGNQIGQVIVPCSGFLTCPEGKVQEITLSVPGIHRVVLHSSNDVAYDTISFGDIVSPVPEPGTLGLIVTGLVGLGLIGRRARR